MSLVNVCLLGERALVGVDTLSENPEDETRNESTKVMPIAHARTVFAGRGVLNVVRGLAAFWGNVAGAVDFDRICAETPGLIDDFFAKCMGFQGAPASAGVPAGLLQIVIVGWSEQNQCMQGILLQREQEKFHCQALPDTVSLPALEDEGLANMTVPSYEAWHLEVAKSQVRTWTERDPKLPIGGRLLLTTLTRDSLRMDDLGLLS